MVKLTIEAIERKRAVCATEAIR